MSVESVEGGPGDLRLMAKQDWFVDLPASRQEPMHSSGEAPRNSEGRRKIIIIKIIRIEEYYCNNEEMFCRYILINGH